MTAAAPAPLLPTYARLPVVFTEGDGSWLVDDEGRRYLDLFAGIAVVGLGHCHPAPLAAARAQLERLWHVSNTYWTEPMQELAGALSKRFGGAHAFLCNSGTESIEAALKWARRVTGRRELVALDGSFHGRTMGSLSVTGQPAKREPFEPLVPGVRFATPDTLADDVGPQTAAILLEPIQGESGIWPLSAEALSAARALADEHGAMLIFDEIQTGVGRTGTFFAWEDSGVRPDAVTLAKGLANGLPIGALLVSDAAPTGFAPGEHANTFGGNPVTCAAACAVIDAIDDELLASVRAKGARAAARLNELQAVSAVRGRGLMLGVQLDRPAKPVVEACLAKGLLVGTSASPDVVRLTPALTISDDDLAEGLAILERVLA
jgi:acetylornithine/N-succinyldiaminopimelate aminotransferase